MVVLFVFGLFVFFIDVTKAADWVNDPNNCPIEYAPEGVSCSGGNVICGVSGAACIDPALIVKRTVDSSGSQSLHSGGFDGGYLVNCTAIRDADGSPYCDNNSQYWCNRDASCYNDRIQTICLADTWAGGGSGTSFNCATISLNSNTGCISGYTNCSSTIAGCETPIGASCTVGGLTGSLNASCSCIVPTQNFVTGIEALFSTSSPLLWGRQYGEGDLISFSNATSSNIFVVKNDASVFMSSTLATTTEQYFYNYNGDLYWGDTKLNTGGGIYLAGSGLDLIGGNTFIVSTTQDFIWSGQHSFGTTTTFPNGIWGSDGRVGIGTTTPAYTLSLVVGDYDGITLFDISGQMAAGLGVGGVANAGLALFNRISGDMSVSLNSDSNSYINNDYNFGIGTTTPDYKFTLDGDGFLMARGLVDNPLIYGYQGAVLSQTGTGTRMFYYPRKGAFRSGNIIDMSVFPEAVFDYVFTNEIDQWNDANIGTASFAANVNTKASGNASAAFGVFSSAVGLASFVGGGVGNYASNTAGIIGGRDNQALNWHSFIGGGYENTTLGWSSAVVGGKNNTSTGRFSFIGGGEYNEAIGRSSIAFGEQMRVQGENSFGINLFSGSVSSTLIQNNTLAIMGGFVGIGTTTPQYALTLAGDFDIAKNGLLRFNGISGSVDQVIKINASGFPEWVDVDTLFTNNTIFNSSTEFYSTSTFNSSSIFNDATEFNSTSTFNSVAIFNNPTIFNDNVFVSGTIYSDNLTVYGTTTLNDIYVTGQAIFHDILPEHNLAYTLGTSSLVWKEGWFGKIFTPEIDFTNNWKLSTTTDGGLAFTSSTQVALAMLATGQVGINTTTIESNLQMKVDGNIGSRMYCDINGENCFDPSVFGWSVPQSRIATTTPASYNGNFSSYGAAGGKFSYEAANEICSSTFGSGYHLCQANEIIDIVRIYGTSTFSGLVNGWVANGPPGYVTVSTNDCEGYTTSSALSYGAWWKFNDNNGGGSGKMISCNSSQPLSCCK